MDEKKRYFATTRVVRDRHDNGRQICRADNQRTQDLVVSALNFYDTYGSLPVGALESLLASVVETPKPAKPKPRVDRKKLVGSDKLDPDAVPDKSTSRVNWKTLVGSDELLPDAGSDKISVPGESDSGESDSGESDSGGASTRSKKSKR